MFEKTGRISGSKSSDLRQAIIDHFKNKAEIMIATEAGAEGVNLQFCSMVINYDLPWNPQRIEQRIGRCHRYGQKNDVVVIVSRGGKTAELLPIIDVCNKKEAITITITENLNSPLAEKAQIIIPLKIEKESDIYNVMATASFAATIAIFDAMLVAIMVETDYKLEQFALIHPGGAVGTRLN
jgi:superfamily II DNA/RNA helicase